MNSYPPQGLLRVVTAPHRARFPIIVATVIFLTTLIVTGVTGGPAAGAPPPIPQIYSLDTIQVKFLESSGVDQSEAILPSHLMASVAYTEPLFSLPESRLDDVMAKGKQLMRRMGENHLVHELPDLNLWFQITLKSGTDAATFIETLRRLDGVEIAEPAPLPPPPPAVTPDFTGLQGYLGPATDGIDATFSATIAGGDGTGVKIYDVEYSWNQTHEDLSKANGVPLLLSAGDSSVDPFNDNNHGTAVLGELIADNDTKGATGISWGADIGLAPANTANLGYNPANAILLAVADGEAGDVILIEQQFWVCGTGSFGPSEWISSVFDAIQVAVANGLVVVEAAGNGSVNLDQASCNDNFDRSVRDSGAIIVGAGGPPGSSDRERLSFSSYGSRVDVQGWGSGVMTTGYGGHYTNPDAPTNPDFFYTSTFNGTSSASPIVAGAVANLQGIALDQFGVPLTPFQVRQLLVETGSLQQGDITKHIGPRPNLRAAIERIEEFINHPPVAVCQDVTVSADASCQAAIVETDIDGGSFDPDDDPITLDPSSVGPYGLGTTNVTLTVTDDKGDFDSCTAMVNVVDEEPPGIACPASQVVECTGSGGAVVSFTATATDNCSSNPLVSCDPASESTFPLGLTSASCSATDTSGNVSECGFDVTVEDTLPPAIFSVSANPNELWPPNHKMVPVDISVDVSDICDPTAVCRITDVTSNEPTNGEGSGNTVPDWEVDGLSVNLRAERLGSGDDRIYTITIQCTDASENIATETVVVTVPHDRRNGSTIQRKAKK